MRVVNYIRCSTQNSEDSPRVQSKSIRAYCEREGHEVVKEYLDYGVSGGLPLAERPGARLMLQEAKGLGVQGIVALRLERFSRNLHDLIGFVDNVYKHKLQLLFATEVYADDATGRLMLQIIGAIAEFYRTQGGQRVKEHHQTITREGRWAGGPAPIGYVWDKDAKVFRVDSTKAATAELLFDAFVQCCGNAAATARMLNDLGHTTRDNREWSNEKVRRVVNNPLYAGLVHFGEVQQESDIIPALVDR